MAGSSDIPVIDCNSIDSYSVLNYIVSKGASVIFLGSKETNVEYTLKIFHLPGKRYSSVRRTCEIYIEQLFTVFLTEKILDNNITPHIIRCIYAQKKCNGLSALIKKIIGRDCPSRKIRVNQNIDNDWVGKYCDVVNQIDAGILDDKYESLMVETWGKSMNTYILSMARELEYENSFRYDRKLMLAEKKIDRLYFQIMFTLAAIRSKYPGFIHGDLFTKNIVVDDISSYGPDEYFEYHLFGKIFYFSCNGSHAKLIDFQFSRMANNPGTEELSIDNIFGDSAVYNMRGTINDTTDTWGITGDTIYEIYSFGYPAASKLAKMIEKYVNMEFYQQAVEARDRYGWVYGTDGVDSIAKAVKLPEGYIRSDIFDKYTIKPPGAKIVKSFNKQ